MKEIPILTGKAANRFIKKANSNLLKKGSIDFSKQSENARKILIKANL